MHAMRGYAVGMSKVVLSIGTVAIAVIGGLIMSGWLAIQAVVYLTNSQM